MNHIHNSFAKFLDHYTFVLSFPSSYLFYQCPSFLEEKKTAGISYTKKWIRDEKPKCRIVKFCIYSLLKKGKDMIQFIQRYRVELHNFINYGKFGINVLDRLGFVVNIVNHREFEKIFHQFPKLKFFFERLGFKRLVAI